MSGTVFPAALDDFTNPAGTDKTNGTTDPATLHSLQHAQGNDALEAIQAKLGIDSSTDHDSIDYRVNLVETVAAAAATATDLATEVSDRAAADAAIVTSLADKADLVSGKVPSSQLPAYVDDVVEYANFAALPATGATGIIYVARHQLRISLVWQRLHPASVIARQHRRCRRGHDEPVFHCRACACRRAHRGLVRDQRGDHGD
jgi:hypothetical protein